MENPKSETVNNNRIDYYSLSPEELEKIIDQFELSEPVNDDTPPETSETETASTTETEDTTNEKQDVNDNPPETPTDTQVTETKGEMKETAVTEPLIDDKFISKYSEDDQKILLKYKDKPVSELVKALKNANKLIGKKAMEVKRELFPDDSRNLLTPNAPVIFPQDKKGEEVEGLINNLIINKIRNNKDMLKLSDDFELPPNMDIRTPEYKQWLRDANIDYPADLRIFESYLAQEREGLRKAYNEIVSLRENYKEKNDTIIDSEIEKINNYFSEAGINLKDYGFVFDDKLLESLIFVDEGENKKLDKDLFEWINGEIPILINGKITNKFIDRYAPQLLKKIRDNSLEQGRKEGVNLINDKKPTNKGLGATNIAGEVNIKNIKDDKDYYSLPENQLDEEIRRMLNTQEN